MRAAQSRAKATVMVSVIAVLAAVWLSIFSEHQRQSRGPEVTVSGRLQDWSTIKVGRFGNSRTLRFRLEGHTPDFRIDSAFFREAMNRVVAGRS